jgi:hypothetical protein
VAAVHLVVQVERQHQVKVQQAAVQHKQPFAVAVAVAVQVRSVQTEQLPQVVMAVLV